MPKQDPWKLKIYAKSEIEVPADVEVLLLAWHGGKRKAAAALKAKAEVYLFWSEIEKELEEKLADREELAKIRNLRDWALVQHDREGVAPVIADLLGEANLGNIEKQLARLDEEDAAAAE